MHLSVITGYARRLNCYFIARWQGLVRDDEAARRGR
jgi:hypothetical protein